MVLLIVDLLDLLELIGLLILEHSIGRVFYKQLLLSFALSGGAKPLTAISSPVSARFDKIVRRILKILSRLND